jgi:Domain of unknown function (DUF4293)
LFYFIIFVKIFTKNTHIPTQIPNVLLHLHRFKGKFNFIIMIQRIQSIFLFLASGSLGTLFIPSVSIGDFNQPNAEIPASADGYLNIFDNKILLGLTGVALGIAFLTIFLFKSRPNQIRLAWVSIVACLALLGMSVFETKTQTELVQKVAYSGTFSPSFIAYIPMVVALIFGWLAIRNIRKDEILVRSADRLR